MISTPTFFLRCRLVAAAVPVLLAAGCEFPFGVEEDPLIPTDAIRIAVYQKLIDLDAWEQASAFCLSDGTGTSPGDPPQAILPHLATASTSVVPLSACSLTDGTVSLLGEAEPQPAQLFHIERLEVRDNEASVSAFHQRDVNAVGGYDCELKSDRGAWRVISCGPSPRNDEFGIQTALYRYLAANLPWPPPLLPSAFCLSQGSGSEERDPGAVVMLRLMRSDGQKYFVDSDCTTNGSAHAPGNFEALKLRIDMVEAAGDRAFASVSIPYEQGVHELRCELVKQQAWNTRDCWRLQKEFTEDEIAARVALYRHLAVPHPVFHTDLNVWCVSERAEERVANEKDPVPAVMNQLTGDSPTFLPISSCSLTRTPPILWSVHVTPDGELAGWIFVGMMLVESNRAYAVVWETSPYSGYSMRCALESRGSQVWEVQVCDDYAIIN